MCYLDVPLMPPTTKRNSQRGSFNFSFGDRKTSSSTAVTNPAPPLSQIKLPSCAEEHDEEQQISNVLNNDNDYDLPSLSVSTILVQEEDDSRDILNLDPDSKPSPFTAAFPAKEKPNFVTFTLPQEHGGAVMGTESLAHLTRSRVQQSTPVTPNHHYRQKKRATGGSKVAAYNFNLEDHDELNGLNSSGMNHPTSARHQRRHSWNEIWSEQNDRVRVNLTKQVHAQKRRNRSCCRLGRGRPMERWLPLCLQCVQQQHADL